MNKWIHDGAITKLSISWLCKEIIGVITSFFDWVRDCYLDYLIGDEDE